MILFFNPRSATTKPRIPLSILALMRMFPPEMTILVDGNLIGDPVPVLEHYLDTVTGLRYCAITVMPGPQLQVAIRVSRSLKQKYPHVIIIWGGYFASFHYHVILESGWVDYVIRGPGEQTLVELIHALEDNGPLAEIPGLIRKEQGTVIRNADRTLVQPDDLPRMSWDRLDLTPYLSTTFLGSKTINYHSSTGCPYPCTFCAVNELSGRSWKPESVERTLAELAWLYEQYDYNALEFHDNNFFISESRVREIASGLISFQIAWWGEGSIATMLQYKQETWSMLRRSGLKMVFTGAESGSEQHLAALQKQGVSPATILEFARVCLAYDIVPEFSFMLGTGTDPDKEFAQTRSLIDQIKRLNKQSIIVLYLFSPVALTPHAVTLMGTDFSFPSTLEEWEDASWREFDLRRGSYAPWLPAGYVRKFRNFETVLNARFPAVSNIKMKSWARTWLPRFASWRYRTKVYALPIELKLLLHWAQYQRPEEAGL